MIIRDNSAQPQKPAPPANRPDPVDGDTVRLSRKTTFWILIACVPWFGCGVLMVREWAVGVYEWAVEGGSLQAPALLLMGLLHAAGAFGVGCYVVRKRLVARRLVLGADRVQLLEGRGDRTAVLVSIPYANIEAVGWDYYEFAFRLKIELADTHDPDTYLPGVNIEANFLEHGYHHAFTDNYALPTPEIAEMLWAARRRWRTGAKQHPGIA